MKKILLVATLATLCFSGFTQQQKAETRLISRTHWLIGTWKGQHNGSAFYETWRKKADNSLVCYQVSIKGRDTSVSLNSEINFLDSTVVFRDPDVFKAVRIKENEVVFERSENGFSRLIWFHTKEDHWWALLQFPQSTPYYDLVRMPELDKAIEKYLPKQKG